MLIFLDEAGDTGIKFNGSSQYFILSLVIFYDKNESEKCNQAIIDLRKKMRLPPDFEFHFSKNNHKIRESFLKTVGLYKFSITAFEIDKTQYYSKTTSNLYISALDDILNKIRGNLGLTNKIITLTIDERGNVHFLNQLKKFIKSRSHLKGKLKIKVNASSKDNLLQLADYSAGIQHMKAKNGKNWKKYEEYISNKRIQH